MLKNEISKAIEEGYCVFISGMSRDVDMWSADIVTNLKKDNKEIKLICAVPYYGFEQRWTELFKCEYERIVSLADLVVYINREYKKDCFAKRNMWMIDHCSRVIAVWNGHSSGTGNTVRYAIKQEIEVVNVLQELCQPTVPAEP